MDALAKLQAIEDIKRLKARYCHAVDTKAWDAFARLFTPDATFEAPQDGLAPMTGAQAFAEHARVSLADGTSIHHCHTPDIAITGPDTATGIWAMQDILSWDADVATVHGFKQIIGWGHYHETFRKTGGVWRIATWMLTRLRLDFTKHEGAVLKAPAEGQRAVWS
jgi:hypothetical protein